MFLRMKRDILNRLNAVLIKVMFKKIITRLHECRFIVYYFCRFKDARDANFLYISCCIEISPMTFLSVNNQDSHFNNSHIVLVKGDVCITKMLNSLDLVEDLTINQQAAAQT